jgi:hypothetical protein
MAIFVGDFNMKLYYRRNTTGKNDSVLKAIQKIANGKYEALLEEEDFGTMASLKQLHINDNIIVPVDLKNRFFPGVIAPLEAFSLQGTEYLVCRDVDLDKLAISMFTDHWPVTAYYKL